MATPEDKMSKAEGQGFLESLLNRKLRIHTTDERMFWGDFKCTDPDRNIVLAHTYEYRQPSAQQLSKAAQKAGSDAKSIKMDMTHRYLGLVVVPGEHIVRIEKEDFATTKALRCTLLAGESKDATHREHRDCGHDAVTPAVEMRAPRAAQHLLWDFISTPSDISFEVDGSFTEWRPSTLPNHKNIVLEAGEEFDLEDESTRDCIALPPALFSGGF
ncbi:hypothetical protein VMCG_03527 [Cytospora schulzeri]|uniref:Sm domain-containing protein n=1 Tax=Cytospora schulzeri TaxID=448051 RepID=A0A423WWZ1_9PEZI|nr:hypothetical protein VMCG_03527 [Valsa malicola]